MASTRLILSEGDGGPSAAGAIIETFGSFVMQGNYVIGVIVFIILVIVNFVVITKGFRQDRGSRGAFHSGRDAR